MKWYSLLLCMFAFSTNVLGQEEESFANYDAIVSELKASAEEPVPPQLYGDLDWSRLVINGGLGLVTSYVSLHSPEGVSAAGFLKGFEAHIGANIFSPKVRGELAFRNFADEALSNNLHADLKEFEARIVFLPVLERQMRLRMGAGLSARYMDLSSRTNGGWYRHESSVPSSALLLGIERKLSQAVSVGPDIAYRSTMATGTYDKSAWDASFRLNATF